MKYKVKIKKLPTAQTGQQVNYGMYNPLATMGGKDGAKSEQISVSKSIGAVPREKADLEAEGGETVMTDLVGINIPQHYTIKGPRHAQGGVPMSLPDNSFVFSDFNEMKINDPDMLAKFGKTVKKGGKGKGFTPADIAKQYDINKYIKILQDPNSDAIDKKTAELMIKNYNLKLGALGLAQEAKKGFEDGVPEVSTPYMDHVGITERDLGLVPKEVQELAQMISTLLSQGLDIVEVLSNLVRQEVELELISEALVEAGMPQQEVESTINDVLANLQNQKAPQQTQQMQPDMQQEMMPEEAMTPEMMMYGGQPKRKLRRRQEGGMSPEMQQQDPMAQIVGIIEQMFAQGMDAVQVASELLQQGISPEDLLQVFVQMGMPEQEATAVIQEVMSQGQPSEMMDPSMMETMKKGGYVAAEGMNVTSEMTCPEGMIYDPIYGCIPQNEQNTKEYTPEQVDEFLENVKLKPSYFYDIKENLNPDYKPKGSFYKKMLEDNKIPYSEPYPGQYAAPSKEELDSQQRMQLEILEQDALYQKFKILNQMNIPPNEWMNYIQNMELDPQSYPFQNFEQDQQFYKLYQDLDNQYEDNIKDCPCRKKELVNNQIKEVCVPCEEIPMAKYGMEMGGYNMPFYENLSSQSRSKKRKQLGGEADQLMQEVAQALQQGMAPEQVMQALVQQGVPQDQAQMVIEQVMQQMQPMARYGMETGKNPYPKYYTDYQKGGQLKKYQDEGEVENAEEEKPEVKQQTVSTSVVPAKYKNNKRYDTQSDKYSPFGLKKGDYIKTPSGWKRLTADTPERDASLTSIIPNTDDALLFQRLQSILQDEDVKTAFAEKYKDALSNKNYFTTTKNKVGRMWEKADELKKASPDEIVNAYLDHIKSNLVLKGLGVNLAEFKQDGTVEPKFESKYKNLVADGEKIISIDNIKKKNVPGWKADETYIAKGQAGQWALRDLVQAKDTYDDNLKAKIAPLNVPGLSGVSDESGTGLSQQFFSPIDGYDHNTSAGHMGVVSGYLEDVLEEEEEEQEEVINNAAAEEAQRYANLPQEPIYDWSPQAKRSAAFLTGAYFNRQKQYPWAPPTLAEYPEYALYDPTRAIAAAGEQAAITAQGISNLGQSAGTTAARLAQISGQQAEKAANIATQYDTMDVGVINSFTPQYANISNQAQARNQAMRKGIYDDTMRMLDQYRKEGLGIKEKMVENANVADAAAAKRYNLSKTFSDYDVLPDGRIVFTGQEKQPAGTRSKSFNEYIKEYRTIFKNDEDVIRAAKIQYELDNKSGKNDNQAYELMGMLQQGGMVLGSHVFPFMFY